MVPLVLTLDHAQRRLARDRVSLTAAGLDFDGELFENTWIDGVTRTLMLRPNSQTDGYHASNSGIYAKLSKADYTLFTAANWEDFTVQAGDGPYLHRTQGAPETVKVTTPFGRNQGVCVSLHAYTTGNDRYGILLEFGWSDTGDGGAGRSFRWMANGDMQYWLDGEFVETNKLGLKQSKSLPKGYVDLTVLPMRRREILFVTSGGEGFSLVLDDIPEDEADPEILPAESFWWFVPSGDAMVQVAKLQFPTSGYATTLPGQFGVAPALGSSLETWANDMPAVPVTDFRVLGDPPYKAAGSDTDNVVSAVSFVKLDGTAFVPDGAQRDTRIKIELAGDGNYTPFVYAGHGAYAADAQDTPDFETDITDQVDGAARVQIEIPDEPGYRMTFTLQDPTTLEGDVPKLLTLDNRPVKATVDGLLILDGRTEAPEFMDAETSENERAHLAAVDRITAALRRYVFKERVPFDGMDLCKSAADCAVRFVLQRAEVQDSEMDLDDVDFRIPEIPPQECGEEFNFLAEVGDTAEQVLDRLRSAFIASFFMGPRPTANGVKYWCKDPDALSTTPVLTLYRTIEDAIGAGISADEAVNFVYGEHRRRPLAIEANEVRVTGYDLRRRQPIQAYDVDTASQDPTLDPVDRPDNWTGDSLIMGVLEPKVTTLDAAKRCVSYLMPIVSKRRFISELAVGGWPYYMDGPTRVLLWKWDVITLDGVGDVRVGSGTVELHVESAAESFAYRESRWTGMAIGTGHPSGQGGRSLDEMVQRSRQRARNRLVRRPGWEKLSGFFMGAVEHT